MQRDRTAEEKGRKMEEPKIKGGHSIADSIDRKKDNSRQYR